MCIYGYQGQKFSARLNGYKIVSFRNPWQGLDHRRRNWGAQGRGHASPPLFQGWHTHFCLVLIKKTMNLSILPVCNSLLSVLSQKHASFIAALLEIDCFLPVVHCCFFIFTDALPLISGRGLKFCAHASHMDHPISWPPHIQYASAAYHT